MSIREEIASEALWAQELTPDELEQARRGLIERFYAKGSYVCHRGDSFEYWTGVREGLIKISAISAAGKAMTFAGMAGGSWFGEGSVLKNEPRQYDVVAIRDTRLALMPRATFLWLFENSKGFSRYLVRQLNERLGQFIASIEYDRILDPKARVARNLSWFFNPVLCPNVKNEIEISQEELGLLAGVSRQVVNRALQALQDEGLLRSEHGRIIVTRPEALSRYDS